MGLTATHRSRLTVSPRFDAGWAFAFASERLSRQPVSDLVRPVAVGELVAKFVLPLELCPTLNAYAEMPSWRRQKLKANALAVMLGQCRRRRANPLGGRPLVRAIRLSSVEPDRDSGWPKIPIDRLTVKRDGLRFIGDDRPSAIDLRHWWESAPPKHGFVYLDIWTGER